jgi:sugar lactone lactonase YvrE
MKRLVAALVALVSVVVVAAAPAQDFPARIELPDGWQPEGIAAGAGGQLYVGSIGTGGVYRINARTGRGRVLVPGLAGRSAIGVELHERRVFVAGGQTGSAFVYSARTGRLARRFGLAPRQPTFVNDVTVTDRAAYFTDSRRPFLYVVRTDLSSRRELALPDIPLLPGNNLNGIAATRTGRWLIAVQTAAGRLWRIEAATGRAVPIRLVGGSVLTNGDGLLLEGRTLYVVQNRLNQVAVVRLNADYTAGHVLRTLTTEGLDVPTTIARVRGRLYVVNARFGTDPMPATDYWVSRLTDR